MPKPIESTTPITKSNVAAAFIESLVDVGHELDAWRRFGEDVQAFLKREGRSEAFGAFQAEQVKQRKPAKKKR